ncbi:MAG: nitroreductase family protein [Candidatus Paceibacterota bacterium]
MEGNKIWCKNASILIVVISKKNLPKGDLNIAHSFDTGAAWENLALQSTSMNLISHGMAGFDYILAKKEFSVPDDYNVEMMIAIGKPGKIENLPEAFQEHEKPSDRKPLEEIISEGKFNF